MLTTRPCRSVCVLLTILLLAACRPAPEAYEPPPPDPEWLHGAMKALTDVMVHDIFSPPQASRAYAYASVAAYEALAPTSEGYASLAGQLNGLGPAPEPPPDVDIYAPLAAVHALTRVGKALVFSEDRIQSSHASFLEMMQARLPEAVFEASVAYGDAVADHILAWAAADGYRETRTMMRYTVTEDPGRWVPTPPAYMEPIEPHWNKLRPFVLDRADQFAPEPPVPYDMSPGSPFHEEVLAVYEAERNLTDEEQAIAAFWDCNPYVMHTRGHVMFASKKITPGGHWMGITAIANRQAAAGMLRSAEAYALVAVALADGFISAWDEKYRSELIRPETVINTYIDEAWKPVLQTPPFPEYTSGHSVISTAAAEALTELYGDDFAFADTSEVEYGLPVRTFDSFREAAAEAAISRLYGGIHYPMAIHVGVEQGRNVGELVVDRLSTRAASPARTAALDTP